MNPKAQETAENELAPWSKSNELAVLVGSSGQVLEVNDAFARKVGTTLGNCIGAQISNWCPTGEEKTFETRIREIGVSASLQQRWRSQQGWRWIEWEATRSGNSIRLIGRDVSARHLAEGHLARLSQAVDQSPFGILITAPSGRVQYMNAAYSSYSGYTLEDALEPDFSLLKEGHPSESAYRHFCATVAAGAVWQGKLCCLTKDGRTIWERVVVSPAQDENGTVTHLLCIRENLTAQIEVEEKLARTQKQLEEEYKSHYDFELPEETHLVLQGATVWTKQAAQWGSREALKHLARISDQVISRIVDFKKQNEVQPETTMLQSTFRDAVRVINSDLPNGRRISFRGAGNYQVLGDRLVWSEFLSRAAKNFLVGHESQIEMRVSIGRRPERKFGASRRRTLELKLKRIVRPGKRSVVDTMIPELSDSDLAYMTGVVAKAGGEIRTGLKKPWKQPFVAEIPVIT